MYIDIQVKSKALNKTIKDAYDSMDEPLNTI